jgi:hypothetical protein
LLGSKRVLPIILSKLPQAIVSKDEGQVFFFNENSFKKMACQSLRLAMLAQDKLRLVEVKNTAQPSLIRACGSASFGGQSSSCAIKTSSII